MLTAEEQFAENDKMYVQKTLNQEFFLSSIQLKIEILEYIFM